MMKVTKPSLWIAALEELRTSGDKKPLQRLLRNCELSPEVGEYLADLIERGVPSPPKGGKPRTPIYFGKMSDKNAYHEQAIFDVRVYRQEGLSLDDALKKAAKLWGLNETSLRLSYTGHHTSFRRAMKKK